MMGTLFVNKHQEMGSASHTLSSNLNSASKGLKVSIGIMVDKAQKTGPGVLHGKPSLPLEGRSSFHEKLATNDGESGKKIDSRQEKFELKNSSPWVSTRSKSCATPVSRTIHIPQNDAPMVQSEVHRSDCESKRGNDAAANTMLENQAPFKGGVDKKVTNVSSSELKRKLWEVLGSAPSQSKKVSSSQTLGAGTGNPGKEQNGFHHGCEKDKLKLSDTIENDSETPIKAVSRPVTRSRTQRKQAPKQASFEFQATDTSIQRKPSSTISKYGQRLGGKRVLSFDGQEQDGTSKAPASDCLHKMANHFTRNPLRVEPRRLSFDRTSASSKSASIARECATSPNLNKNGNASVCEIACMGVDPLGNPALRTGDSNKSSACKNERTPPSSAAAAAPSPSPPAVTDMSLKNGSIGCMLCPDKIKTDIQHNATLGPQKVFQNSETVPHEIPCNTFLQVNAKKKNQMDLPQGTGISAQNSKKCPTTLTSAGRMEYFCNPPKSMGIQQLDTANTPALSGDFKKILTDERMSKRMCTQSMFLRPASNLRGSSAEPSSLQSGDLNVESSINNRDGDESPSKFVQCTVNDRKYEENFRSSGMSEPFERIYGFEKNVHVARMNETQTHEIDDTRDKGLRPKKWFTAGCESPLFPFHCYNNRFSSPDDESDSLNPPSSTSTGKSKDGETSESPETMEKLPEDGLLRSISQLVLTFKEIKTKIKMHSKKKRSEILSSVEDKIRLQLFDIESQIQADLKNFATLAKSKRKHLESTFHAQHEKFKAINEKFKEEVSRHMLECRTTLQELEAFGMESKGTLERQRLVHRKLVMQMEEAVESHFRNAETNIIAIQKVARKKSDGLKDIVREFLNEGMLSG